MDRIPVTIITGFLGSGKTTLLNRLLTSNQGKRIAIIENEFGDLNIDKSLITDQREGIYELSNGCICCTLNNEWMDVLSRLLQREQPPEYLIIETTGLADPTSIVLTFVSDVTVQSAFELDAVITLADAAVLPQQLAQHPEAAKQLALADVVLLNKTDLVNEGELEEVKNKISACNPQADCRITSFAETDGPLLYLRAFRPLQVQENLKKLQSAFYPDHLQRVSSLSLTYDKPFDFLLLNNWINYQLNGRCGEVYRCKGILEVEHFDQKVVFQGVYDQHMVQMGESWKDGEDRRSTLVFIGKDLNPDIIREGLSQCITEA